MYIDDLVILSVLQFSDAHVASSPIEVQRADALYDFLQMPTSAGKSGSTLAGEFWGGHLDGVAGTLGFPLERRVSLMLITMLVAATGVSRTLLQRLFGACTVIIAFLREAFVCLDVAHAAAATLAPSRRCQVKGALFGELLLVTGLAPLLETKLRAEPGEKLYATDASPEGAGECAASITQEDWFTLYDLPEKRTNTSALSGRAKNHQATCMMVVQRLLRLR